MGVRVPPPAQQMLKILPEFATFAALFRVPDNPHFLSILLKKPGITNIKLEYYEYRDKREHWTIE